MGDVMGPLSYPPWREGETLPPYPPPPNPTPPPARARSRGYSELEDYGTPSVMLGILSGPASLAMSIIILVAMMR